jgi:hypothetical protein
VYRRLFGDSALLDPHISGDIGEVRRAQLEAEADASTLDEALARAIAALDRYHTTA